METNAHVQLFAESIDRLFVVKPNHIRMDDGGLSIEWKRMCVRIYPPDEETGEPNRLEVVVHNLERRLCSGHSVALDTLTESDHPLFKEIEPYHR